MTTNKIWNPTNIEIYIEAMKRPSNAHKRDKMMVTLINMVLLNSKN